MYHIHIYTHIIYIHVYNQTGAISHKRRARAIAVFARFPALATATKEPMSAAASSNQAAVGDNAAPSQATPCGAQPRRGHKDSQLPTCVPVAEWASPTTALHRSTGRVILARREDFGKRSFWEEFDNIGLIIQATRAKDLLLFAPHFATVTSVFPFPTLLHHPLLPS
jgi:hypothetical protein